MAPGGNMGNLMVAQAEHVESSEDSQARSCDTDLSEWRTRGKAVNRTLHEVFLRTGQQEIEIPDNKWRPITKHGKELVREAGIICRANAHIIENEDGTFASDWRRLKQSSKDLLHNKIKEVFILVGTPKHVKAALERIFSGRLKDFRHSMHKHYKKYPNHAMALANSYDEITSEVWGKVCAWFASDNFKKISEANIKNRKLVKTQATGGSKSFAEYREELRKGNPEVGPYNLIDFYYHTHYSRKKNRWISEEAHRLHDKMILKRRKAQVPSVDASTQNNTDNEIASKLLGCEKGYVRGLGHGEVAPPSSSKAKLFAHFNEATHRAEIAKREAFEARSMLDDYRKDFEKRLDERENELRELMAFMREQRHSP